MATPTEFAISGDTCSNKSVAGTSTCTVSVVANPFNTGAAAATLTLPDNSALGARTVALSVNGHVGPEGTYHALAPARLLDTRSGLGAAKHVVGPGTSIHLQVSGRGGVPSAGVSAVQLNVTEITAAKGGYLTVFPTGVTQPTVSNLNYTTGLTEANAVTVALGTSGQIDIYNAGTANLLADVSGYFVGSDALAAGGQYNPIDPFRLLDSRYQHKRCDGLRRGLPGRFHVPAIRRSTVTSRLSRSTSPRSRQVRPVISLPGTARATLRMRQR